MEFYKPDWLIPALSQLATSAKKVYLPSWPLLTHPSIAQIGVEEQTSLELHLGKKQDHLNVLPWFSLCAEIKSVVFQSIDSDNLTELLIGSSAVDSMHIQLEEIIANTPAYEKVTVEPCIDYWSYELADR